MSRLYVRVMTGFYSHRKTARLRAVIGDDAFWLPPRLWAYAAENQPDGDMSGYAAAEIAMLVGYSKDATSMLQALTDCGFMDLDGKIHGWDEHNGYHQKFAKRAKTAAEARWSKEKSPTPPKEDIDRKGESGDKHCLEHATSMLVASESQKRFIKPLFEEVRMEAGKSGVSETEAQKFFNYYESNGWRVGRNPMKNWQRAFSNWKLNIHQNGHQNTKSTPAQHIDRSVGTLNEGIASRYAGLGKVAADGNIQRP